MELPNCDTFLAALLIATAIFLTLPPGKNVL
jgi:hypothetical protein